MSKVVDVGLESLSRISFNDSFIYGHIFLQNSQKSLAHLH